MTLASALTALCDMLRTQTGAHVILGVPDDSVPGVYVWPWRLDEDAHLRNAPAHGTPARILPSVCFLVLASPALTADGLSKLDKARLAMLDRPILDVGGKKAQVLLHRLADDALTALFTASTVPLTICLSGQLKEVP